MTGRFDLRGKVAIVTGGNGGIGLGMARGLADSGADIAVVGRNAAKSKTAVADLAGRGVRAIAVTADVSNQYDVAAMVAQVSRELGRIDILINNAGMSIRKPPHLLELEEWREVIDTNLTSAFLCSKAAYPALKANGGGKIINIGSMLSIFGASFAPAYAASKGGIVQYTRACACAWAPDNIQVNAILPGWIKSDMTAGIMGNEKFVANVMPRIPVRRFGEPSDFGGIAVYLMSKASSYHTADCFVIDGGYTAF